MSAGATLEFGGGTHTLTAASSVNAASGAVSFSSGTVTVAGSYNTGTTTTIAGAVTFSGTVTGVGSALTITGTATFNSSDVTIATLNLQSSGVLGGSANVNVTGTANWSGGTMTGAGATNIPAGATLNLTTGLNNHLFLARALNNAGTAILTQGGASGTVFFLQSGTFNNQAGGVFDIRADRGINSNGGTNLFANAGVVRKSAGTGLSTVGIPFNNNGTVEVDGYVGIQQRRHEQRSIQCECRRDIGIWRRHAHVDGGFERERGQRRGKCQQRHGDCGWQLQRGHDDDDCGRGNLQRYRNRSRKRADDHGHSNVQLE